MRLSAHTLQLCLFETKCAQITQKADRQFITACNHKGSIILNSIFDITQGLFMNSLWILHAIL